MLKEVKSNKEVAQRDGSAAHHDRGRGGGKRYGRDRRGPKTEGIAESALNEEHSFKANNLQGLYRVRFCSVEHSYLYGEVVVAEGKGDRQDQVRVLRGSPGHTGSGLGA